MFDYDMSKHMWIGSYIFRTTDNGGWQRIRKFVGDNFEVISAYDEHLADEENLKRTEELYYQLLGDEERRFAMVLMDDEIRFVAQSDLVGTECGPIQGIHVPTSMPDCYLMRSQGEIL